MCGCNLVPQETPGQVQGHSGFEWLCKHNRLRPEPIRFVRSDSEHAQSDAKSMNRGLPELDLARGSTFSSPKAALLLVSSKNRDLWLEPLAVSNDGSPRFTDFSSLCACSELSLINLIGSVLNLLCLHSIQLRGNRLLHFHIKKQATKWRQIKFCGICFHLAGIRRKRNS